MRRAVDRHTVTLVFKSGRWYQLTVPTITSVLKLVPYLNGLDPGDEHAHPTEPDYVTKCLAFRLHTQRCGPHTDYFYVEE